MCVLKALKDCVEVLHDSVKDLDELSAMLCV